MRSMPPVHRIRAAAAALLGTWIVAAPRLAEACAVCSPNDGDPAQYAFARASIFLSVMPLLLLGGIGWWVWRRARKLAADEAAGVIRLPGRYERPPVPPAEAPSPPVGRGHAIVLRPRQRARG